MTWIAATPQGRRQQFGPFLLGTGGIGGIALNTGPGIGLSEQEGVELIERAVEVEGVKIIDTADAYTGGASERAVGAWRRAHPDSSALIQTKTGATLDGPDLSPERIAAQLRKSIDTLGTVDLYLAHRFDPDTPWSRSLPVLSDAVADGRIRAYGLSNVTADQLTDALETADQLGLARPEVIQNSYSLLARGDERALLPIVASENLAYTPYSALSNGLLSGRYSSGEAPVHGSRADNAPHARGLLSEPGTLKRLQRFDAVAAENGLTPAGLAQAWVLSRPLVTAFVAGVSKASHWQGLREAASFAWTPALTAELDDIFPA